jgi:hypothetical protein
MTGDGGRCSEGRGLCSKRSTKEKVFGFLFVFGRLVVGG